MDGIRTAKGIVFIDKSVKETMKSWIHHDLFPPGILTPNAGDCKEKLPKNPLIHCNYCNWVLFGYGPLTVTVGNEGL